MRVPCCPPRICTFVHIRKRDLCPSCSRPLPANAPLQFHAGQYIDIVLANGQRRSYSLATAPHQIDTAQPRVELHIRHMPGGTFTDHVFAAMKEKEILRIEGPLGGFYLHPAAQDNSPLLFLASGTGFAPVKAMLEVLAQQGSTRPTTLYWGVRRPHDLYMHQWMLDYVAAHPHVRYVPVISDALPEDVWSGCRGLAMQTMLDENPDMRASQLYSCGTPAMVQAAHALSMEKCGLLAEAFFADAFTSQKDKAAAPAATTN